MTEAMETDVLVVGGGLAGLTAAVGLRESGLRTIVVESEDILGGRARSWTDETTGDPVHIGPHIFMSEYPNMRKLLRELGTEDRVVWNGNRFILIVDGRTEIPIDFSDLPAPLHFAPSLNKDPRYTRADVLSNVPLALFSLQLTEEDVLRLDGVNASAFMRSMGVTDRFVQGFWAFTSMAIMNVPLELCSAGALLRFYRRLIGHTRYQVGFADGGLGDLFAPGAKSLIEESGGQVLLGARVRTLDGDARRVTGATLEDGRAIRARYTVAALPPDALRCLSRREWMRHAPFRDLSRFVPSPYVSTFLWFDRKLTHQRFWARSYDPNDLSCDFYDLSNIHTGWQDRPSLITTNCIWCHRAEGMDDEAIVAATVRELADYIPEAAEARVVHSVVNRIPMAIHCPFPGTESLRPQVRTAIDGLFLAGDWIATGLPSSMESACMAGWRVAEEVLAEEGRRERLAVEHLEPDGMSGLLWRFGKRLPLTRLPRWIPPHRFA